MYGICVGGYEIVEGGYDKFVPPGTNLNMDPQNKKEHEKFAH